MNRFLPTLIASGTMVLTAGLANAATFEWDNSLTPGTYSIYTASNWLGSNPPVNAAGNIVDFDDGEYTYDINNGGANFDMGLTDEIIVGRGVYNDSVGDDDAFIGNVIAFNGAGGASPVMNVMVIADTFTSDRHGAILNRSFTVNNILAQSEHQDRWELNASATGTISSILIDENRGDDGDSVDGLTFEIDADMDVTSMELVWGMLRIGGTDGDGSGAGTDVTVDTFTYHDHTNKAEDNNITPIAMVGDMTVTTFNWYDVENDVTTQLAAGTYGAIGNGGVDNNVDWITSGDGVLTVVPEPASLALLGLGGLCLLRRRG